MYLHPGVLPALPAGDPATLLPLTLAEILQLHPIQLEKITKDLVLKGLPYIPKLLFYGSFRRQIFEIFTVETIGC